MQAIPNLTVKRLAVAKGLNAETLATVFQLRDGRYAGQSAVIMPVHDAQGHVLYEKARCADGTCRRIPAGGAYELYGLHQLTQAQASAVIYLVEGESNVWAAREHGVVAVATGGANNWRPEFATHFVGRRIVAWEEPGKPGESFVSAIGRDLPRAWVIAGDDVTKDLAELHAQAGPLFSAALRKRRDSAVRIANRIQAINIKRTPVPAPSRAPEPSNRRGTDTEFTRILERARSVSIDAVCAALGIPLMGRGTERTGRCPLHKDSNPSMSVSLAKNLWHCHACGRGDVSIALVQLKEGLSFRDAVQRVASL